ncbi:MAG: family acetyltransferase [Rhodoferax sp.]|nr:family acetyltransferase [Rhodoferax sp.]
MPKPSPSCVEAMRDSLEQIGRFDPNRARERFLATFAASDTRHIFFGGARAGVVVLRSMATHLLLDHLYILPTYQGKGVGAFVLKAVCHEADALGQDLKVGALKQSRANAFYQRHGFQLVAQGEWDLYYVRHPQVAGGKQGPWHIASN